MEPAFYDENDTESWLTIVGDERHYHFGNGAELVRYLYRYIPADSTVLDCGCGWGGPASLLAKERGCKVTGVTISQRQFQYIRGNVPEVNVVHADMAQYAADAYFDVALFIQSFTHMRNPVQVLRNLRASRVVIQDFLGLKGYYYDPLWRMHFYSLRDYLSLFSAAGYQVVDREIMDTAESLATIRRDGATWVARIDQLPPGQITGQIALLRESSVAWSEMQAYDAWCQVVFCLERSEPTL